MSPNLLITVSSDIGLQLAQLGNVASNIDPTILSSTIPALKSMVTSEISKTDSSFMTGTTDYTRFGTFAIKTEFDVNLIVTYLISYNEMEIPSNEFDQFAEDVTITFGHLLSRSKDLKNYIENGRTLDPKLIIRNFIDALILARLRNDYVPRESNIESKISEIINSLFEDKNNPKIKKIIDLSSLKKNKSLWETGILRPKKKKELLREITFLVLWELVYKYPISAMLVERPKDLNEIIEKRIVAFIHEKFEDPLSMYKEQLGVLVPKKIKLELSKIKLEDSHRVTTILKEKLLAEATLKIAEKEPLFILVNFDEKKLLSDFYDMVQPYLKMGMPQILKEAVKMILQDSKGELVGDFIEGWLINFAQISLDSTTIEMLKQILEEVVSLEKLKEKGKLLIPDEYSKWFKSWDKIFEKKGRKKSLQFTPFQGVLIVDSSIKTLAETFKKGLHDLLLTRNVDKNYFLKLESIYNIILPIISIGYTVNEFEKISRKHNLDPIRFIPSITSVVLTWSRLEKHKLFVNDSSTKWVKSNYKKAQNIVAVNDERFHPLFLINPFVSLNLRLPDGSLLNVKNNQIEPQFFFEIYKNKYVPVQSIAFNATLKLFEKYNSGIFTWLSFNSARMKELEGYISNALNSTKSEQLMESFVQGVTKTIDALVNNVEIQLIMGSRFSELKSLLENIKSRVLNYRSYDWKKRRKKIKEFYVILNDLRDTVPSMIEFSYIEYLKKLSTDFVDLGNIIQSQIKGFVDPVKGNSKKIETLLSEAQNTYQMLGASFFELLSSGFRPTDWQVEGKPGLFLQSQYGKMEEALNSLSELLKTGEKTIIIRDMPLSFIEGKPVIELCSLKISVEDEEKIEQLFPFKIKYKRRGAYLDVFFELSQFYSEELFDENYLTLSQAITILTWKERIHALESILRIGKKITQIFGGSVEFWDYLIMNFLVPTNQFLS